MDGKWAETEARIAREIKEAVEKHGEACPVSRYPDQVGKDLHEERKRIAEKAFGQV